jgi:hypothetical protein
VVGGQGPTRLAAALAVLQPAAASVAGDATEVARWHGLCDRCGDPDCERHPLPRGY